MTINFTNEEHSYLYTDDNHKMRIKENAPEEMKNKLRSRVEAFNRWVDEMNGAIT